MNGFQKIIRMIIMAVTEIYKQQWKLSNKHFHVFSNNCLSMAQNFCVCAPLYNIGGFQKNYICLGPI